MIRIEYTQNSHMQIIRTQFMFSINLFDKYLMLKSKKVDKSIEAFATQLCLLSAFWVLLFYKKFKKLTHSPLSELHETLN